MFNSEEYIEFTLVWKDTTTPVHIQAGAFHSLMGLISAKLAIPGFGICNGMGSCGTCALRIVTPSTGISRRVLSCSVPVDTSLMGKQVVVDGV